MVGRARIEIDALGKFVNLVADLIVTVPLRDYRLWSDLRPLPPALEGHLVINIATNCGGIGISLNGTDRCGHQEDKKGTNQANHLSIIEGSSEPITGSKMNSSEDAANVRVWLQADMASPEIEVRSTPNSGHSETHAGLPRLTRFGHSGPAINVYFVPNMRRSNALSKALRRWLVPLASPARFSRSVQAHHTRVRIQNVPRRCGAG